MTIVLDLAWLLALGVATLYGWIMYNRGHSKGIYEQSMFAIEAMVHCKKVPNREEGFNVMQRYLDEVYDPPFEDEEQ